MLGHALIFKDAGDLRALVEANDFLRQVYKDDKSLIFPSIVVMGEQSNGKTSLIENITNLNLPRGTGVQTRVPTEIRLRNGASNSYKITYTPKKELEPRVVDFSENTLEETMRKVQSEVTGNDNSITDDLIILTIERTDLLPLTFVDLPGYIVQSSTELKVDVEEIIRGIYIKYICNPNNQLLVVTNAANDIENSQIIKLCRKYDSKLERVMLCTNKIDLRATTGFDKYLSVANAFGINRVFFVRNKTEDERKENRRLDEVREIEKNFIQKHVELSRYDRKMLGIVALRNYLVEMQKEKILPAIRANYEKVIQTLSERRQEQFELIKYTLEPSDFRLYLKESFGKAFAEAEQTFSEHSRALHKTNFYRGLHAGDRSESAEARFPSAKATVPYTVSLTEDGQLEVTFDCPFPSVFYAELVSANQIKNAAPLPQGKLTLRAARGPVAVAIWMMQDFHYFTFQNKLKGLHSFVRSQYNFDYFLGPHFAETYKQHEMLSPLEEAVLDDVAAEMHREILHKQIIPKFLAEADEAVKFAKDFVRGFYAERIGAYFEEYPFVATELTKEIGRYFQELFKFIDPVIAVLAEGLYETDRSNRNDRFLTEFLQSLFGEKPTERVQQMLTRLTGADRFNESALQAQTDRKAYNCGVRLFLTITYKFQYFTEALSGVLKAKLIRGPLTELHKWLLSFLQDKRFADDEELRLLMRPNEKLYNRQIFLKNEIQRAESAIERMKSLRTRFPNLQTEFEYVDRLQAVKLEGADEKMRAKIAAFLNSLG